MTRGFDAFMEKTKLWKSYLLQNRNRGTQRRALLRGQTRCRKRWGEKDLEQHMHVGALPVRLRISHFRVYCANGKDQADSSAGAYGAAPTTHRQMLANSTALSTIPRGVSP